jgi:hypothetical protein
VSQPAPAEIAATSASGLAAQGSAGILRNILNAAGDRTVVVALGSPYSILNFPSERSYLCTYSWLPTSERSAAKAPWALQRDSHAELLLPVYCALAIM